MDKQPIKVQDGSQPIKIKLMIFGLIVLVFAALGGLYIYGRMAYNQGMTNVILLDIKAEIKQLKQ